MRSQMEQKAFKDLPEQFLNGINSGLTNNEEFEKQLMKNKLFENSDINSLRKFFQIVNDQTAAVPKIQTDMNSAHVMPNLPNDQSLSTSFLNLSKMSHLDSSNAKADEIDLNNDNKKIDTTRKSGQSTNDSKHNDSNGKCTDNNQKEESDEESQRDSSSMDDEMLADGKKVRVRSVLSEDTLRVLRAQYAINPRPKKQEISRLAEQVNYPPRVVQVWFQNMR